MYNDHVTVFNFYESPTTGEITWCPHVLQMCDLVTDRGAIIKKYGADSTDNAQLHVRWYDADAGDICVLRSSGDYLPYLPPKEWKKQTNDKLTESITFSDKDFFCKGIWIGRDAPISDDDYRGGFYQHVNNLNDNVFKISSVGGPYTAIPHFEILGK